MQTEKVENGDRIRDIQQTRQSVTPAQLSILQRLNSPIINAGSNAANVTPQENKPSLKVETKASSNAQSTANAQLTVNVQPAVNAPKLGNGFKLKIP